MEGSYDVGLNMKYHEAVMNLKLLTPYFGILLDCVGQKAMPGIGGFEVSEDTFFCDPDVIRQMEVSEITFLLIHEMCHIVMRHHLRCGSRDRKMWNTAADLYVNEWICKEFGVSFGEPEKVFDIKIKKDMSGIREETLGVSAFLKAPPYSAFSMEGTKIDLKKDTPESVSGQKKEGLYL